MDSLMWIDCTRAGKRSQRQADALRQHVMLNHLAKKKGPAPQPGDGHFSTWRTNLVDPLDSSQLPSPASSRSSSLGSVSPTGSDDDAGGTLTMTKRRWHHQQRLPTPESPSTALVSDRDQEMYRALWWHAFQETKREDTGEWKVLVKKAFSNALQETAKRDETVGAIFMCLAAAKEAHIHAWEDSPAYRLYKGRALSSLAKAIAARGTNLPDSAILTMSLLCRSSIVEEHLDDAEVHCRGLTAIFANLQLDQITGPLWQFFVWADLRITGAVSRAPRMPFWIHPEYDVPLPHHAQQPAKLAASLCATCLPQERGFLDGKVSRIIQLLYQLSAICDAPRTVITTALRMQYETAYLLASMQTRIHGFGTLLEQLVFISLQMQFWGTMASFSPQRNIHRHLSRVVSKTLSRESAESLSQKWLASGATFGTLLWMLFNVSASVLYHSRFPPDWLRNDMRYVTNRLDITNVDAFRQVIYKYPHSQQWAAAHLNVVYNWVEDGVVPDTAFSSRKGHFFHELGLLFDEDVRPVKVVEEIKADVT